MGDGRKMSVYTRKGATLHDLGTAFTNHVITSDIVREINTMHTISQLLYYLAAKYNTTIIIVTKCLVTNV